MNRTVGQQFVPIYRSSSHGLHVPLPTESTNQPEKQNIDPAYMVLVREDATA